MPLARSSKFDQLLKEITLGVKMQYSPPKKIGKNISYSNDFLLLHNSHTDVIAFFLPPLTTLQYQSSIAISVRSGLNDYCASYTEYYRFDSNAAKGESNQNTGPAASYTQNPDDQVDKYICGCGCENCFGCGHFA